MRGRFGKVPEPTTPIRKVHTAHAFTKVGESLPVVAKKRNKKLADALFLSAEKLEKAFDLNRRKNLKCPKCGEEMQYTECQKIECYRRISCDECSMQNHWVCQKCNFIVSDSPIFWPAHTCDKDAESCICCKLEKQT